MNLQELKKCNLGITHNGLFHADDVFSAAFLKLINPNIKIIRTSDSSKYDGLKFDIGLGEFDHHIVNNEVRDNGVPYASFGKLWKKFAPLIYGDYVYEKIDKHLVQNIDYSDNTGNADTLSYAISSFNDFTGVGNGDLEFIKAVDFASILLSNMINNEIRNLNDEKMVIDMYKKSKNKKILVLNRYLHFKDSLPNTEVTYVIYPSKRGGYLAQAVTINSDTTKLKKPFPKKWLKELPTNLTFCHQTRFLIGSNDLNDIINACELSLKEE